MSSGWCSGICERTGEKGDFPAECVYVLPAITRPPPEVLVSAQQLLLKPTAAGTCPTMVQPLLLGHAPQWCGHCCWDMPHNGAASAAGTCPTMVQPLLLGHAPQWCSHCCWDMPHNGAATAAGTCPTMVQPLLLGHAPQWCSHCCWDMPHNGAATASGTCPTMVQPLLLRHAPQWCSHCYWDMPHNGAATATGTCPTMVQPRYCCWCPPLLTPGAVCRPEPRNRAGPRDDPVCPWSAGGCREAAHTGAVLVRLLLAPAQEDPSPHPLLKHFPTQGLGTALVLH